ncbi:MAG TPA: IPTL-CTERM sorting domain-containing protein [Thermoanaerobaculia bacterium]|nr:IPTL-CTERM sorting domain-containing protein [Thermoanaerobaculia bacterium]
MRRNVLLCSVLLTLLGFASPAAAVVQEVRFYLDTDLDTTTGCLSPTPGLSGAELRLTVTVDTTADGTTASVESAVLEECVGSPTFGNPVNVPPEVVQMNAGLDGFDVVEACLLRSALPPGTDAIRLAVATTQGGVVLDTLVTIDGDGGEDIVLALLTVLEIPTLSEWALILLALLLFTAAATRLHRRGPVPLVMLALLLTAGGAWAVTGIGPGDLLAENAAATDDADGQIRALYARATHEQVCLRADVSLVTNQPPTANGQAVATDEDVPELVILTGSDPEGGALTFGIVTPPVNGTLGAVTPIDATSASVEYTPNADYDGPDSFTFEVTDPFGATSAAATVAITVTGVNDPPVAADDAYAVDEGGTINEAAPGVLANDSDPEADPLTAVLVTGPSSASAFALNADGSFAYTHDGGPDASDSFTYQANDGTDDSNVVTVTITINQADDAPTAVDDAYGVDEGGTINEAAPGVLANDTDDEGDPLTAILGTGPANASSFTFNADGSFVYTHDGSETTSDSFTYVANDGSANSSLATVTITVTPINDAPVAVADNYAVGEGGTINEAAPGVLANDTDDESDPLTAILETGPAHASSFTLNADGSFDYTHDGGAEASDSFTYKANDGTADSNIVTVTITINQVDDAPVAVADAYGVNEGGTINEAAPGVLANDTDDEGDPLSAILVTGPANASSFALNADGSFTYTHDGGETVSDSFTYKANDGTTDSNTVTVTITVTAVNDAPVAVADAYGVNEGGTISEAAPGVLANDTDAEGSPLTAVLVTGPTHASSFALNADGSFTYIHDAGPATSDSFTYRANDGTDDSNVVTVTIAITQIDDAPVAAPDAYGVNEGGTINEAAPGVLGNDTDDEGSSLSAVLVTGPTNSSSFALNSDGSFLYIHNGSETVSDSFTYRANDGTNDSNVTTVTITVTPVNDAPVANPDAYGVLEGGTINEAAPGVLGNDTDGEGDSLSAVLVTGPTHASSFTLSADGSFSYEHDGSETLSDSFTYRANDGTDDSNVTTVTITITPVNDVPVANPDAYGVLEGGSLNEAAPGVLGNDSDAEGSGLSAVLVTGPAHASSFTLNADGSFSYVHNDSETVSDSFTYLANDGSDDSNTTTVTITITPVNDCPTAVADAAATDEDTAIAGSVVGNDSDSESDPLVVTAVNGSGANVGVPIALTGGGLVTINADGTFSFDPNSAYEGLGTGQMAVESVNYTIDDQDSGADPCASTATLTITITGVNDAPLAGPDTFEGVGNTLLVVDQVAPAGEPVAEDTSGFGTGVLANDSDVEGQALVITAVEGDPMAVGDPTTAADGGVVTLESDGTFTYTPPPGENTSGSFTYTVSDGEASTTATVTINLAGLVWYVDNSATGPGAGTSTDPFSDASSVDGAGGAGDVDGPADTLFFFQGDSDTPGSEYGGELPLEDGQNLIGEGVDLVVGGITLYAGGGATAKPVLTNGAGSCVTLTGSATIAGVTIRDCDSHGIAGADVDGTLVIDRVMLLDNGGFGLRIDGDADDSGDEHQLAVEIAESTFDGNTMGGIHLQDNGDVGTPAHVTLDGVTLVQDTAGIAFDLLRTFGDVTWDDSVDTDSAITVTGGRPLRIEDGAGSFDLADVQVTGSDTATMLSGVLVDGVTGAGLSLGPVDLTGTGSFTGPGVQVSDTGSPVTLAQLDLSTVSGKGVYLSNHTGAFLVTSNASSISGTSGVAFDVEGGDANVTYGGSIANTANRSVEVTNHTGGTVDFNGPITDSGRGILLDGNGGATLRFDGRLDLDTTTNTAFTATNSGTVVVIDAASTVNTTTGNGVVIGNTTIGAAGVTFANVSVNGAANGILLTNAGSGAFSAAGGTLNNVTSRGVDVAGGTGNVTYAGSISTTASGRSVEVTGHTGGTVVLSGAIDDNGLGINLQNNAGATLSFTGALDIDSTTNTGFNATGGGTVTAPNAANTIDNTTGTALRVEDTTIGAAGLVFLRIATGTAAAGPLNAIILDNTGTMAGLTVNGTGTTDATGGVLRRTTGDAVVLASTRNVTLKNMVIGDPAAVAPGSPDGNNAIGGDGIDMTAVDNTVLDNVKISRTAVHGIDGTGVTNLTVTNSEFLNTGDGNDEHAMAFNDAAMLNENNIDGTVSITNTVFDAYHEDGIRIENFAGTLNMTVSGSTFANNDLVVGENGIQVHADGSNNTTLTVNGNTLFDVISGNSIAVFSEGASSVANVTVQNVTIEGSVVAADRNAIGILLFAGLGPGSSETPVLDFLIDTVTINDAGATGISIQPNGQSSMRGTVSGNTINGTGSGRGIEVLTDDEGDGEITISGNNVTNTAFNAIFASNQNTASMDVSIRNNTGSVGTAPPYSTARGGLTAHGIEVNVRESSVNCLDIASNSSTGADGGAGFRTRQRDASVFRLERFGGDGTNSAAVENFLVAQNTSGTASATVSTTYTGVADNFCDVP